MGKLDIKKSIVINANARKAWEHLGPEFINISKWGRGISKSWHNEAVPTTHEGAPAGGRFCEVAGFGQFDERIMHYDDNACEITWSAESPKMPGFVKGLHNAITVKVIDENSCEVTTNVQADTTGLMGMLMGGMMKSQFSKALDGFLSDLKTYTETGDISEKKKKEVAKMG